MEVRVAVERAAQDSYGKLLAYLASRSRDVEAVEDALSEAFVAALESWPGSGIPKNPEAWLLTSARNRLTDMGRRGQMKERVHQSLVAAASEVQSMAKRDAEFPDERLKLLFICAHPAIDEAARTPLMLQTVLNVPADKIASAFLVAPATMSQRLVRAKRKIRDAGISFDLPDSGLEERVTNVLDAIYAAYGTGWDHLQGADAHMGGLSAEAIYLGRLVVELLPKVPEAKGLLALMLLCQARREARRDQDGQYVPFSEQDPKLWSTDFMGEAERNLEAAVSMKQPGRYQLEACIQSAHIDRRLTGRENWEDVLALYEGLLYVAPSVGALVNRASALAEVNGSSAGLEALEDIEVEFSESYQPYWALRGHLLNQLGRGDEARVAYERAIGMSEDPAVRTFLAEKMKNC